VDQRASIDKADRNCAETRIISLIIELINVTHVKSKTALITGTSGVVGRNLAKHLIGLPDWNVIGVSRHKPDIGGAFRHIAVDLLDAKACAEKASEFSDVTHVFSCAYVDRPSRAELVAPNLALLKNCVEAVERSAKNLQHVHIVQGTKWYGSHLGPFKTPAKETDPRHAPPNFYYDQQDWIAQRQLDTPWTWSTSRPHAICGFSVGSPMNLTLVIAVYAAISKELGLPLSFPGAPGNFHALYQVTDSTLLAQAMTWMSTTPACANQAFNLTNGDLIRWGNFWPRIANFFGMEAGPVRTTKLAQFMADKGPVWDRIVKKYSLQPYRFEQIAAWPFGDFVFASEYDMISDMGKARRYGFGDAVDSEEMFLRLWADFRREKIIP
jgi:nucleoside-diphosphate-sugar epimerase